MHTLLATTTTTHMNIYIVIQWIKEIMKRIQLLHVSMKSYNHNETKTKQPNVAGAEWISLATSIISKQSIYIIIKLS